MQVYSLEMYIRQVVIDKKPNTEKNTTDDVAGRNQRICLKSES